MVIAAASPPPAASPRLYPPYKEMIVKAIWDLGGKDGSSKKAISKFIAANFTHLPPAHNALLGTHIRRLKSKGVIVSVKKSYMLAGDGGRVVQRNGDDHVRDLSVSVSGKRKPGRPPKMAILAEAAAAASPIKSPRSVRIGDVVPRKLGRPRKVGKGGGLGNGSPLMLIFPGSYKLRPASILAALNPLIRGQSGGGEDIMVVDGSEYLDGKRKRGRPRKVVEAVVGLEGRKRGRPRKIGQVGVSLMKGVAVGKRKKKAPEKLIHGMNQGSGGVGAVEKWSKSGRRIKVVYPGLNFTLAGRRKRGIPDKVVHPRVTPVNGGDETSNGKRKRGRPLKVLQECLYLTNGGDGESVGKRKPGRAKKFVQSNLINGAAEDASGKRKRGRPRKVLVTEPNVTNGSVNDTRLGYPPNVVHPGLSSVNGCVESSSGKRKLGRPKKLVLTDMRLLEQQHELEQSRTDMMTGAVEASGGDPMPEKAQETDEPVIDLMNVVDAMVDKGNPEQPVKSVTASIGKSKVGRPLKYVQPDLSLANENVVMNGNGTSQQSGWKRKAGRPIKEASASLNKVKIGRPMKYVNLKNGDVANGNAGVNRDSSSLNSSQQSVEKKKLGRPKKVVDVDDNATLSSVMHCSSERAVGKDMLDSDPTPAAVNVLVGMRIPDVSGNISSSSSALVEDNNDDSTPASLTTSAEKRKPGRPKKLLRQSPTLLGGDRILMPNPVISSSRKIVGEVEIVMPTIKRRGRPTKRSNAENMAVKEEVLS